MSRARAVLLMLLVTLLWSTAGVVTKRLDSAASFEVTFWRSAFTLLSLLVLLSIMRGPQRMVRDLFSGGWPLVISSLCWSVMFTAFMVALTMTTVANVLVTMALGPLFTALLAAAVLGHRLPMRTWVAIVLAGLGIAWMVRDPTADITGQHLAGIVVALGVPIAGAINWTLLQALRQRAVAQHAAADAGQAVAAGPDMIAALVWAALISAALTLPLAWPLEASARDIGWLAVLGATQLAIPCMLAVSLSRVLSAPEISLLALCEILFGVAWAWLGAGEAPSAAVLGGGLLVIVALSLNEWLGLRASAMRTT